MLCAVLKRAGSSIDLERKIQKAAQYVNVVELRFDHLIKDLDIRSLDLSKRPCPLIFTFRRFDQGGAYQESEEKRQSLIQELLSLRPDFFDIEADSSLSFLQSIGKQTKIIASYHDFDKKKTLDKLLEEVLSVDAFAYKIASSREKASDAIEDLLCYRQYLSDSSKKPLIFVSMGKRVSFSRLLTPFSYVAYDAKDLREVPDQQSLSQIKTYYSQRICRQKNLSINPLNFSIQKKIMSSNNSLEAKDSRPSFYALLGDPVEQSISHVSHNQLFRHLKLNALYLKIPIYEYELERFLSLSKNLDFKGFSVTMPLKEAIFKYLSEIDDSARQIGSVNTIVVKGSTMHGFNTDGVAALDALEQFLLVRNKRILLIGAGGAARAIAYEAKKRGAKVYVKNRSLKRADKLVLDFDLEKGLLDKLEDYSIIVNATPHEMPMKLSKRVELVMDIKLKESCFLKEAKKLSCVCLDGKEMFFRQAALQFELWFGSKASDYLQLFKLQREVRVK